MQIKRSISVILTAVLLCMAILMTSCDALSVKKVEEDCKRQKVKAKDLSLYIKPEDNACYYVANNGIAGKVDLY